MSTSIPEFRQHSTCEKCGYHHLVVVPDITYNSSNNTLTRTCKRCGYKWAEKCQDGSEPTNLPQGVPDVHS